MYLKGMFGKIIFKERMPLAITKHEGFKGVVEQSIGVNPNNKATIHTHIPKKF